MTEQDYINVRDVSNVMHAGTILRDICIENQPNIPREEYHDVVRKVTAWRDLLFEAIHQSRDQSP
jgi:hypothetical protein